MTIAYLDTQVVVWLHDRLLERLTQEAKRQIEKNDLLISPMAFLELQYLFDRKRVSTSPLEIYTNLHGAIGLSLCNFPFPAIAIEALSCTWTNDPFDRIIVSHAKANGEAVLVTSDVQIRQHYPSARW